MSCSTTPAGRRRTRSCGATTSSSLIPSSAERIAKASEPLRAVGVDAALMIHEEGVPIAEVEAFTQKWSIVTPEQAKHSVSFVTDPTWRAYAITYSAGRDLCRAYIGDDPARFRTAADRARAHR